MGTGSNAATIAFTGRNESVQRPIRKGAKRSVKRSRMTYLIEDVLQFVLSQGRTFDILDSSKFLGHSVPIFLSHWLHLLLGQFLTDTGFFSQIGLGADNQTGDSWAVVTNFGEPFLTDVLKRSRRGNREADQEDISLWIRKWAETIVILLTGGIE